jgi:putrescine transport system ATP-binding protein
MAEYLRINGMTKSYGQEPVLKSVSFSLDKHKVLSVLGESGSGKTTLLRVIAGLESMSDGTLEIALDHFPKEFEVINDVPPHQRNIVYLNQEPLLFPHLDVFENVAFGLEIRKWGKSRIENRVNAILEEIGMTEHRDKLPHQLSGGQKQRVSFARAMVVEPKVLLLDEPFGALDNFTRSRMQELFTDVSKNKQLTSIFITHDVKEALLVGDEIGRIVNGEFTKYSSKTEFVKDQDSGALKEAQFWQQFL